MGGALAKIPRGALRVREDLDGIQARLEGEFGFERRSMLVSDGTAIPDGIYLERRGDRLRVWVPPDPARSVGNAAMLPSAVELTWSEHEGRRELSVRPITPLANRLSVLVMATLTLGWAAAIFFMPAPLWVGLGAITVGLGWIVVGHQSAIAADRRRLAWQRLAEVLPQLEAPEAAREAAYRALPPDGG